MLDRNGAKKPDSNFIIKIIPRYHTIRDTCASCYNPQPIIQLKISHYDLVFMDIQMPVMDGLESTGIIRDHQTGIINPDIPIIVMTAHAMQEDKDKYLKAGMDDCITKPLDQKQLLAVIENFVPNSSDEINSKIGIQKSKNLDSEIFDKNSLLERLDNDYELYKEIIEFFLNDFPMHVQKLEQALAEQDTATILFQSHTIKGASANIGANTLREIAGKIELAASVREFNEIGEFIERAKYEFVHLLTALSDDKQVRES